MSSICTGIGFNLKNLRAETPVEENLSMFNNYIVKKIGSETETLFNLDGSVNLGVAAELFTELSKDPGQITDINYQSWTARNFSNIVMDDNTDTNKSGALMIKLFPTVQNSQSINDGTVQPPYSNELSSQWFQLVYRLKNKPEYYPAKGDFLTLKSMGAYRTDTFSTVSLDPYSSLKNSLFDNQTPYEASNNYSSSLMRTRLNFDYNRLKDRLGALNFDSFFVSGYDLPNNYQNSKIQTGTNNLGQMYTGSTQGQGATSGVKNVNDIFFINNGRDELGVKLSAWNTKLLNTLADKIFIPSWYEVNFKGHNKEAPGTVVTATTNGTPSATLFTKDGANVTSAQAATMRSGLWELNGYDRFVSGAGTAWLRSGTSGGHNIETLLANNDIENWSTVTNTGGYMPCFNLDLNSIRRELELKTNYNELYEQIHGTNGLLAQIAEKDSQIQTLETEISTLETQVSTLAAEKSELETEKTRLTAIETLYTELLENVGVASSEELLEYIEQLKQDTKDMEAAKQEIIDTHTAEIARLNNLINNPSTGYLKQIADKDTTIGEKDTAISALETQIGNITDTANETGSLFAQINYLKNQIEILEDLGGDNTSLILSLQSQISALRTQIGIDTNGDPTGTGLLKDKADLTQEKTNLTTERDGLQTTVNNLNNVTIPALNTAKTNAETERDYWKDLYENMEPIIEYVQVPVVDETALENLRTQMQETIDGLAGQVSKKDAELVQKQGEIDTKTGQIGAILVQKTTLETEKSTLENALAAANGEINRLKNELKKQPAPQKSMTPLVYGLVGALVALGLGFAATMTLLMHEKNKTLDMKQRLR